MNLNKAILVGGITSEIEYKELPEQHAIAKFSLATNLVYTSNEGRKEKTEYHYIVAFGNLADVCRDYLSKGKTCLVEGRIQTRSYINSSGIKNYKTEIVADNIQF